MLRDIDAIGVHGFPGTWEFDWEGWPTRLARLREVLDRHGLERRDLDHRGRLLDLAPRRVPPDRGVLDADGRARRSGSTGTAATISHPETCHQDGFHEDERHYHFGLKSAEGRPKLLYRILAERGLAGLREFADSHRQMAAGLCRDTNGHRAESGTGTALITGGCGFIGTDARRPPARRRARGAAARQPLAARGRAQPRLADRPPRARAEGGDRATSATATCCAAALERVDGIFHLAAQVAVTTSLADPQADFDVNAQGTLNVLEAVRALPVAARA